MVTCRRGNERVHRSRHFTARGGTEKHPVFSADRQTTQVALGIVVVDRQTSVFGKCQQRLPLVERITNGPSDRTFGK